MSVISMTLIPSPTLTLTKNTSDYRRKNTITFAYSFARLLAANVNADATQYASYSKRLKPLIMQTEKKPVGRFAMC